MKKLKYIATILLAAVMLVFAAACTRTVPLDTPVNFVIDDAYTLYWRFVPAARSYNVLVTGVDSNYEEEIPSRVTHISLAHLAEGDYEIKVMAVGGSNNEVTSDWSETVEFHRDRESGLLYTVFNGNTEYAVTGVGTASGDVVLENVYRGKPVTAIAENAFRTTRRISSIVIPEGVRVIGDGAFYNCTNLTSVTMPDSVVSIGANIFQGCSKLASVRLPAQLSVIPDFAFAYCRALTQVEIPETVYYIGACAFYNCSALESIACPDLVYYVGQNAFDGDTALTSVSFGSGLWGVDQLAFSNCTALESVTFQETEALQLGGSVFQGCTALKSIELPEGTELLGDAVFYGCESLAKVTVPETVTAVGSYTFHGTALYETQAAEGNGFIYAGDWVVEATDELKATLQNFTPDLLREGTVGLANELFVLSTVNDRGTVIFQGAPQLLTVELAASVRYIGTNVFYCCLKLNSFTAEAGSELVSVGDYAFQGCTNLQTVRFRDGLRDIGSYAFWQCSSLTKNESNRTGSLVPDTVERIGTYAFNNSGRWTDAAKTDGVVYACNWVVGFNEETVASHTDIVLDDDIVGIADYAFYKNDELVSVENLDRALHIGRGAFFDCTALTEVALSVDLTEISDNAFSGCTGLVSVKMPLYLETIGLRAFYECSGLEAIDLSLTGVKEIGDNAFYNCTNVGSVLLSETLEYIGDAAFYGIDKVKDLVLPDSLVYVGANAFANCAALESITFGAGLQAIGAGAFQYCTALPSVTVPDTVLEIGGYAFYHCDALSSLDLGEGVQYIGTYAFGNTAIRSLVLPASLQWVDDYAFKSTFRLASVLMLGIPEEIGMHAFYGSSNLTFYIAADSSETEGKYWNTRWNSAFRPVVWNAAVSEEQYVTSIDVSAENLTNPYARGGMQGPVRAGYTFVGWATSEGGELVVYDANEWLVQWVNGALDDVTLYAVWEEGEPEEPEEDPETPGNTPVFPGFDDLFGDDYF